MIATVVTSLLLAAPCHAGGTGLLTTPSNVCTPGAYARLTRVQACAPKDRPSIPVAVRRRVLFNYGVPGWTGAMGEIDHRQPLWSGGLTVAGNLWPERGAIPNAKDTLENYVRRRVCTGRPHPMSLRTAHIIFAGNWVAAFRFYRLG